MGCEKEKVAKKNRNRGQRFREKKLHKVGLDIVSVTIPIQTGWASVNSKKKKKKQPEKASYSDHFCDQMIH